MTRMISLLPLVALLACTKETREPLEPPATFADASEVQREAAVHAALGTGGALAFMSVLALEGDAIMSELEGGCLDVELLASTPPTVRITADSCVGLSGATWDGVVVAENASLMVEFLEIVDGDLELIEGPMKLTFESFTMKDADGVLSIDGTLSQTAMEWGAPYQAAFDLAVGFDGMMFRTSATYDCEYQGNHAAWCEVQAGAEGYVAGLGGFDFEGAFTLGGGDARPAGALTLVGEDELKVDFGDVNSTGCAPVTVDGDEVQRICLWINVIEPPEREFVSGGLGCSTDDWWIDGTIDGGGIAEVRATFYFDAGDQTDTEAHILPWVRTDAGFGDFYQLQLPIGDTYVAGESTVVPCETDDWGVINADLLLEALADDGTQLACLVAGQGGRVPVSACAAQ